MTVLSVLQIMDIDINNCRGQCYDNASNMSGTYKGAQSRIREINSLAEWIPCATHTLNLVGVTSANCCEETEQFFTFVQSLFNFFSKSTSRWQIISEGLQANEKGCIETLKSLSDTRWSAHSDVTKALCLNYASIQLSLRLLAADTRQTLTTQNEAKTLIKKMYKLEIVFFFFPNMWNVILLRFSKVSAALQAIDLDRFNAAGLVWPLREYVAGVINLIVLKRRPLRCLLQCQMSTNQTHSG